MLDIFYRSCCPNGPSRLDFLEPFGQLLAGTVRCGAGLLATLHWRPRRLRFPPLRELPWRWGFVPLCRD